MSRQKSYFINEKSTFWVTALCLLSVLGIYLYSLNTVMFSVVERGAAESKLSDLRASVVGLEAKYISAKNDITLDLAYSLGYKETEISAFIPKKSVSVSRGLSSVE